VAGGVVSLRTWLQSKLSPFPPEWLNNPDRLADWAYGHSISSGNVWAITPNYSGGWWLFQPGGHAVGEVLPAADPVAEHPGDFEVDGEGFTEPWMRGWVEDVACCRVVEMVEGLRWWGPGADYEVVIYARVET
jgi:hypothetical protein